MSNIKKSTLLLGASGFLGSYFAKNADQNLIKLGTKSDVNNDVVVRLDNEQDINYIFQNLEFDRVINCIALADIDLCEERQEEALWLNEKIPAFFSLECAKRNIKFTHFSTDAVFNLEKEFKSEDDETFPITVYGKSKLAGEQAVLNNNKESLILRVNFFGHALSKVTLFDHFYSSLISGGNCRGFYDNYFTPLYAGHLVNLTLDLHKLKSKGLFHLVGSERLSKYDFGLEIIKQLNISNTNFEKASLKEFQSKSKAKRTLDLSLSNIKIRNQGVTIPSLSVGLIEAINEMENRND